VIKPTNVVKGRLVPLLAAPMEGELKPGALLSTRSENNLFRGITNAQFLTDSKAAQFPV